MSEVKDKLITAENLKNAYDDNKRSISELKGDTDALTTKVEQLFNVSEIGRGYYYYDGAIVFTDDFYHAFIPCRSGEKLYVNYPAERLTIGLHDNEKNWLSAIESSKGVFTIPNNDNIAFCSVPCIWHRLYSLIVSKNPLPFYSRWLPYGDADYYYNITKKDDFTELLKSRATYSNESFDLIDEFGEAYIKPKIFDKHTYINCCFNTVSADISYNAGNISFAENEKYILAYKVSEDKIIEFSKINGEYTYKSEQLHEVIPVLKHKKLTVSIINGTFKIKDFYSGEEYLSYEASKYLSNYNNKSIGVSYYSGDEYSSKILCKIFNTTDFITYNEIENTQWTDKTWYAYGTSLTNTSGEGKYAKYVEMFSRMNRVNKGISGGAICTNKLIKNAVMNTTDGKTNADLITLEIGANDTGATLGSIYDTGDDTFCGALNQCIRYLQENTNAQIVVISSTNARYSPDNPSDLYTPDRQFGTDKHTKYDQWKAIEKVCELNSVYYIPMGEGSGLGFGRMISSNKYNVDQIHHTELGGYILGKFVWSRLKDIPLWHTEVPTD